MLEFIDLKDKLDLLFQAGALPGYQVSIDMVRCGIFLA
jgi:hypothetical protein